MLTVPTHSHAKPFALWTQSMRRSVLRQMIAVVSQPGVLSFAGGLPAPELFPTEAYARAMAAVLADDPRALQYAPPFQPLIDHIVELMAARGVAISAESVFLTTGAQQGLALLSQLLVDSGDEVLLEEQVYSGALQAVAPRSPKLLTVGTDLQTGMDVDAVETLLARGARPRFIYAIADGHNPLGVSMSLETRRRLVEISAEYDVLLIEDDPYGLLCYEEEMLPPLRTFDDEHVVYLGSFSKIMAPALRLGWMVVPPELRPKLSIIKEAFDLETSGLTQRAVATYLSSGAFPAHLAGLRQAYGARRDAMLHTLTTAFPAEARWTVPRSGLFMWVELPPHMDTERLLDSAVAQEKVAFIPGHAFAAVQPARKNGLRLSFSTCSVAQIEDGLTRLGQLIHHAL